LKESISYNTIPRGKNEFEIRIENLGEVYDGGETY
jgi:hypothetical protein